MKTIPVGGFHNNIRTISAALCWLICAEFLWEGLTSGQLDAAALAEVAWGYAVVQHYNDDEDFFGALADAAVKQLEVGAEQQAERWRHDSGPEPPAAHKSRPRQLRKHAAHRAVTASACAAFSCRSVMFDAGRQVLS